MSSFLHLVGLAKRTCQNVPGLPPLASSDKKDRSLTEATGFIFLTLLSDATPTESPWSVFSHQSEASSATYFNSECLDSPPSLSCLIAAHGRRLKPTTVFASNDPGTRSHSSTYVNYPFGEDEAGFEHWLQDSVLWVHDYAAVRRKDPLAAHTNGSLFLEGDITAEEPNKVLLGCNGLASH